MAVLSVCRYSFPNGRNPGTDNSFTESESVGKIANLVFREGAAEPLAQMATASG